MSAETIRDLVLSVIEILVLIPVTVASVRLMGKGKNKLLPVFFMFAVLSFLLSTLYWVTYNCLRPDTRLPFAADEIAEAATLLLLSAGLENLLHKDEKPGLGEVVFTILFMGTNVVLWILWSGEWFQDMIFGIPYMYLLGLLITGIRRRGMLRTGERIACAIAGWAALLFQVPVLLTEGSLHAAFNAVSYVIALGLAAFLLIKSIGAVRSGESGSAVFLSFALLLWSLLVGYLSDGIAYNMATIFSMLSFPVSYYAVKKEL